MNSLFIYAAECSADNRIRVSGRRLARLLSRHLFDPVLPFVLPGGVAGKGRGKITVESLSSSELVGYFRQEDEPLPRLNYSVLVAIPRPQTIKKVVEFSASVGLSALHLVLAENTQPSYLSSKQLQPDHLADSLEKGAEQSGDAELPTVHIHRSLATALASHELSPLWIADTSRQANTDNRELLGQELYLCDLGAVRGPVTIGIGPERGWSSQELALFDQSGALRFSLGARILRVENALAVISGVLMARE